MSTMHNLPPITPRILMDLCFILNRHNFMFSVQNKLLFPEFRFRSEHGNLETREHQVPIELLAFVLQRENRPRVLESRINL